MSMDFTATRLVRVPLMQKTKYW